MAEQLIAFSAHAHVIKGCRSVAAGNFHHWLSIATLALICWVWEGTGDVCTRAEEPASKPKCPAILTGPRLCLNSWHKLAVKAACVAWREELVGRDQMHACMHASNALPMLASTDEQCANLVSLAWVTQPRGTAQLMCPSQSTRFNTQPASHLRRP